MLHATISPAQARIPTPPRAVRHAPKRPTLPAGDALRALVAEPQEIHDPASETDGEGDGAAAAPSDPWAAKLAERNRLVMAADAAVRNAGGGDCDADLMCAAAGRLEAEIAAAPVSDLRAIAAQLLLMVRLNEDEIDVGPDLFKAAQDAAVWLRSLADRQAPSATSTDEVTRGALSLLADNAAKLRDRSIPADWQAVIEAHSVAYPAIRDSVRNAFDAGLDAADVTCIRVGEAFGRSDPTLIIERHDGRVFYAQVDGVWTEERFA